MTSHQPPYTPGENPRLTKVRTLRETKILWRIICSGQAVYALSCILTGIFYLPGLVTPDVPFGLRLVENVIPFVVWGILWIFFGVLGFISALTGLRRFFKFSYGGMSTLALIWAGCYLAGYALEGGRGFTTTAIYVRTLVPQLELIIFITAALKFMEHQFGRSR